MNIDEIKKILENNPSDDVLNLIAKDERAGVKKLVATYQKKQDLLAKEKARIFKMYEYERQLKEQGFSLLAGVDEAGRGPLAGPLVVAAVILPEQCFISGLNDSKKLTEKKREALYDEIQSKAIAVSVEIVPIDIIDTLNIYQATAEGMRKALLSLSPQPDAVLIDAMPLKNLPFYTISLVRGDSLSASIAAASVVAKVTRDRIMAQLDEKYPRYGFSKHKGYGTKEHLDAILEYGITCEHRKTFEPVKSMITGVR